MELSFGCCRGLRRDLISYMASPKKQLARLNERQRMQADHVTGAAVGLGAPAAVGFIKAKTDRNDIAGVDFNIAGGIAAGVWTGYRLMKKRKPSIAGLCATVGLLANASEDAGTKLANQF